jgi:Ca2+:H+ antiporter
MANSAHDRLPAWSWIAPALACVLLGLYFTSIVPGGSAIVYVVIGVLLAATVFAAVHHAEILALKLGEPFGSILLAVAVTVIEVGLVVSIMLSNTAGSEAVARDTVFAAVMIVLNGVVGLCLVVGGRRHFEQEFQIEGASSALAVLGTLAVMCLVLPNYTLSAPGPYYSTVQMIFVGTVSLVLYGVFVFVQTIRHRDYFLDRPSNGETVSVDHGPKPSNLTSMISLVLLLISLTAVVLLAKLLSQPLDQAVRALGLPRTFVGVVIAAIVLLPEGIASVRAAMLNRLQSSINLGLGSAIASIGLTIPVVVVVSLSLGLDLALGISPANTALLLLTLFMGTITLGTGRTTVLQGSVHLVIFAVFLLVSAVP